MSPPRVIDMSVTGGFPRVSGDEPSEPTPSRITLAVFPA